MVSKEFNVTALRVIPIFANLAPEKLEEMRAALRVTRMESGEIVVREGDAADRLFVLVSGEVQVVKNYLEPGSQTVDVLGPGAFFGEMALIGEGEARSATVVTSDDSHFVTLDREAFKKILLENPDMCYTLLSEAYRRLRQANDIITTLQGET